MRVSDANEAGSSGPAVRGPQLAAPCAVAPTSVCTGLAMRLDSNMLRYERSQLLYLQSRYNALNAL